MNHSLWDVLQIIWIKYVLDIAIVYCFWSIANKSNPQKKSTSNVS